MTIYAWPMALMTCTTPWSMDQASGPVSLRSIYKCFLDCFFYFIMILDIDHDKIRMTNGPNALDQPPSGLWPNDLIVFDFLIILFYCHPGHWLWIIIHHPMTLERNGTPDGMVQSSAVSMTWNWRRSPRTQSASSIFWGLRESGIDRRFKSIHFTHGQLLSCEVPNEGRTIVE